MFRQLGGVLLLMMTVASTSADEATPYVVFQDQHLLEGRSIWLGTCEGCHGYGIAGAPIPMQPDEWQPRLSQAMPTLYQHAIDGFFGPDDTYMPPRGGNPELSDAQVRGAVDYMTALARHYIDKQ